VSLYCVLEGSARYFFNCPAPGALSLIMYGIGAGYAALPGHPAVLFCIFFCVLVLLGYLEGLQVAILALEHTDSEKFRKSAPRAFATHALATGQRGLNVQRFLVR
jgi:hypothetical protein